jgi:hypothetical protein
MGTARRAAIRAALVGAIAMACASGAAAQTVLDATAIDAAKAGRWAAVRVTLDHSGPEFIGDVILSWGGHELLRRVSLVSSGRHQFELYTRTTAAESAIRVRLVAAATSRAAAGREVQSRDVKMRVLPQDEVVTLCVVSPNDSPPDAACSALVPIANLPASHRGYDVADRVVWSSGHGPETWTPAQKVAYERWQAIRQLDRRGDLGLTAGVNRPLLDRGLPADTTRIAAISAVAYCAMLLLLGLTLGRIRARVAVFFAAIGTLTIAGVAGVFAIGRIGQPVVTVHHESLMQQLPGTLGSLLTVQAVAEFPVFDEFALRLPTPDASLETVTGSGRSETVDDEGYPVLAGTYGLGDRRAFSAEAATPVRFVEVTENGDVVRVTNRSNVELRECRFADGFSETTPIALKPSASMEALRSADILGPALMCSLPESVLVFTESQRQVRTSGRMTLVAYLNPTGEAGDD